MKQFSSLIDALSYHSYCYFCHQDVKVNDRDLAIEYEPYDYRLIFPLSNISDDVLFVNALTNEVYITPSHSKHASISSTKYSFRSLPNYIVYNGITYQTVELECKSCFQFSYSLKLEIDLEKLLLLTVSLYME